MLSMQVRGVEVIHLQNHLFSCGLRNLLQNEAGQLKVSDFGLLGSRSYANGSEGGCCKFRFIGFTSWYSNFFVLSGVTISVHALGRDLVPSSYFDWCQGAFQ